jgi:hypothetical protein
MRMGRRLKRTYKWHPNMFEKDSAASNSSWWLHADGKRWNLEFCSSRTGGKWWLTCGIRKA